MVIGGRAACPEASILEGLQAGGWVSQSLHTSAAMTGFEFRAPLPQRSGRREIDACRQGIRALIRATCTPWPSPYVPRSWEWGVCVGGGEGEEIRGWMAPQAWLDYSQQAAQADGVVLSGFRNCPSHSGRGLVLLRRAGNSRGLGAAGMRRERHQGSWAAGSAGCSATKCAILLFV